jgi:hypothetical protein
LSGNSGTALSFLALDALKLSEGGFLGEAKGLGAERIGGVGAEAGGAGDVEAEELGRVGRAVNRAGGGLEKAIVEGELAVGRQASDSGELVIRLEVHFNVSYTRAPRGSALSALRGHPDLAPRWAPLADLPFLRLPIRPSRIYRQDFLFALAPDRPPYLPSPSSIAQ